MIEPLEGRRMLTAAPLLSADVVSSTLPANFVVGSSVRGSLTVDVTNVTGSTVAGTAKLSVFAAPDGVVDASAIALISNRTEHVRLKAGKTQAVKLPIKSLPPGIAAGTYTLLAEVIDPAATPDIATSGPTFTSGTPAINLSLSLGRVAPASIRSGGSGAVILTITNSGNIESTGLMAINLGISSNGSTDTAPLANFYVAPKIAAGDRVSIRLHFKVPATQTSGTFFPYAAINQFGAIASGSGAVGFKIVGPAPVAPGAVNFTDDYTTNLANYTATDETGITGSWTVHNGALSYTRTGSQGYYTSDLLLNPNVASTAGLTSFTTSGDLLNVVSSGEQPGLIISADNTSGGYVITQEDAGAYAGHLILLKETGSQLLGDEGLYSISSPLVADFGVLTLGDSYNISATVNRTGNHPVFQVKITNLTTKAVLYNGTVTDTSAPASYGGDQVGWRVRAVADSVTASFSNLSLTGT